MTLGKHERHVFLAATSSLLLIGLLLLLNETSQAARAGSGVLYASPSGSGSACSRALPCDLQTVLSVSVNDDTVYLAGGTYSGSGGAVITLTRSIDLLGGWDGSPTGPFARDPDTYTTTVDGQGQRRVVHISGSITPTLDGLHLANGSTTGHGGGLYAATGSHTTLNDCQIRDNTADIDGGGAYIRGNATLTANSIYGNIAERNGGGVILIHNAGSTLTGNQIHDNRADWGGGVQTYMSTATLANNDIYRNTAEGSGGGANINETDSHQVTLTINRIYSNTAHFGGGVMVGNCSTTMTGNRIYGNSAVQGGGLWFASSQATLVNNVVDNQATTGNGAAGVCVAGSTVQMVHTTIARNSGGRVGGVLVTDFFSEIGTVAMTNTILVSHTAGILVDHGHAAALEATLWGDGTWANGTDWGGGGVIVTGTVNIWGDPAFLSPDGGDYHIGAASDATDAGVDAGVANDIDDDLRPAPVGTNPDLGADEISQRSIHLPLVMRSF
jgi:parallel beta-helix repeat protein